MTMMVSTVMATTVAMILVDNLIYDGDLEDREEDCDDDDDDDADDDADEDDGFDGGTSVESVADEEYDGYVDVDGDGSGSGWLLVWQGLHDQC